MSGIEFMAPSRSSQCCGSVLSTLRTSAGVLSTDRFTVVHHTYLPLNILNPMAPVVSGALWAYWNVNTFIQQGFDVRSVTIENFRIVDAPSGDQYVTAPHADIYYDLVIVSDPIPLAIVAALASVIVIIGVAFAYTIVTQTPIIGPAISIAVVAIGIGIAVALATGLAAMLKKR